MVNLKPIQRPRIIGVPFDGEQAIETLREFSRANAHGVRARG